MHLREMVRGNGGSHYRGLQNRSLPHAPQNPAAAAGTGARRHRRPDNPNRLARSAGRNAQTPISPKYIRGRNMTAKRNTDLRRIALVGPKSGGAR